MLSGIKKIIINFITQTANQAQVGSDECLFYKLRVYSHLPYLVQTKPKTSLVPTI